MSKPVRMARHNRSVLAHPLYRLTPEVRGCVHLRRISAQEKISGA
jgi:hypothetical protein